jgi:hypothetical protein
MFSWAIQQERERNKLLLLLLLLLLVSVFQIGFAHILVVYKTLESLYLGILMVFVLH